MKSIFKYLLSFIICLLSISGFSTTWYVDSSNGGTHDGTSWATAWANVTSVSGISAGDTIYISGGVNGSSQTYTLASSWTPISGNSGSSITYQIGQDSLHNGTAIFSGSGTFLNAFNYASLVGDAGDGQRHFQTSGFNCIEYNSSTIVGQRIAYFNFGLINGAGGGGGDLLSLGPGAAQYMRQFEFDHNYAYAQSTTLNSGMVCNIRDSDFDQSKIHDNIFYLPQDNNYGGDGADWIETGGTTGLSIYNNTVSWYPTNYTGSQHQDGWQDTGGTVDCKYYNNIVVNCIEYAVYLDAFYGDFTNIYIYNNISIITNTLILPYANTAAYLGGDSGAYGGSFTGPDVFDHVLYFNNIADGYSSSSPYVLNNTTAQTCFFINCFINNNISINGLSTDLTGNNTTGVYSNDFTITIIQAQTNFVKYTARTGVDINGNTINDYHLLSTAGDLIGMGTNLISFDSLDKDGNSRPNSANWDIGPYQYIVLPNSQPKVLYISGKIFFHH